MIEMTEVELIILFGMPFFNWILLLIVLSKLRRLARKIENLGTFVGEFWDKMERDLKKS